MNIELLHKHTCIARNLIDDALIIVLISPTVDICTRIGKAEIDFFTKVVARTSVTVSARASFMMFCIVTFTDKTLSLPSNTVKEIAISLAKVPF